MQRVVAAARGQLSHADDTPPHGGATTPTTQEYPHASLMTTIPVDGLLLCLPFFAVWQMVSNFGSYLIFGFKNLHRDDAPPQRHHTSKASLLMTIMPADGLLLRIVPISCWGKW